MILLVSLFWKIIWTIHDSYNNTIMYWVIECHKGHCDVMICGTKPVKLKILKNRSWISLRTHYEIHKIIYFTSNKTCSLCMAPRKRHWHWLFTHLDFLHNNLMANRPTGYHTKWYQNVHCAFVQDWQESPLRCGP